MKVNEISAVSVVSTAIGAIRELLRDAVGSLSGQGTADITELLGEAYNRAITLNIFFGCEETARALEIVNSIPANRRGFHFAIGKAIEDLRQLRESIR